MPDGADYGSLPFAEAIAHFRQKVNVPSPKWADIVGGAHTRAFTVAGATKEGMLNDFRGAIDKAIAQGTTLETFRQDFDTIVAKYGWDYKGARGWRTRTIYSTNLTTAYAAGRWQQMTDPDVLAVHPYWRYVHADGERFPRPDHLAWNGLTLEAGDDWWHSHYPPNGWGCQCSVEPVTRDELKSDGKSGPDTAPPLDLRTVTLDTSAGPYEMWVPKGIDPGWGYNVGEAAFGKKLPDATMQAWREHGAQAFESLTPGDWQSEQRPRRIPLDPPLAHRAATPADRAALARRIVELLGGERGLLELPDGETVLIDAAALAAHMPLDRGGFVNYLPELVADPYEIWLAFERHKGTGQVVLRKRIIKALQDGAGKGVTLVAQASRGMMEAWTLVPTSDLDYLQRQRVGKLIWGRDAPGGD